MFRKLPMTVFVEEELELEEELVLVEEQYKEEVLGNSKKENKYFYHE